MLMNYWEYNRSQNALGTRSGCQGLTTTCYLGERKGKVRKREQDELIIIKSLHLCDIVYFPKHFPTVRLKA